MCRGKISCDQLGTNTLSWDKHCPLRIPEKYTKLVDNFKQAIELLINGDEVACVKMLSEINTSDFTDWYIEHGQMSGLYRAKILSKPLPATVPMEKRYPVRSPSKLQNAVFDRDRYHCRYCSNRLVSQDLIEKLIRRLDNPVFVRGKTNATSHAIIHLCWPVADHIVPWNYGGETTLDNLVSSCASCNYGKAGYTIEQLGISDPFATPVINDGWNGLEDLAERI